MIGVGTATIAAAVGAGGLGEYIFRGLSMVDPTVILAGAVPAARAGAGGRRRAAAGRAQLLAAPATPDASRRWSLAAVVALVVLAAVARRRPRAARSGGDPRRLEELHRADHPRRAAGADDRARRRPAGRAPAEPGRHVHLRSRAALRRHRRLRRVHRHGPDRGLQAAGRDRSARACSSACGSATPRPG